jgi:hypothetical protein
VHGSEIRFQSGGRPFHLEWIIFCSWLAGIAKQCHSYRKLTFRGNCCVDFEILRVAVRLAVSPGVVDAVVRLPEAVPHGAHF